jgi:hopene-associated glycosyltransferase HpnB
MTTVAWAFAAVSLASLAIWLALAFLRGMFWLTDVRLPAPSDNLGDTPGEAPDNTPDWPSVAVLVPARHEADTLPTTLPGLLRQDYRGQIAVYLIDDGSDDGTSDVARRIAKRIGENTGGHRLTVVEGRALPTGWTGKVWALQTGIEAAWSVMPDYYLLSDADIAHPPDSLARLVSHAVTTSADLVSLMVMLRVGSLTDRLLLPAFVYFFAKLYPFRWSNSETHRTAAAAGGCVLLKRTALEHAGGLAAISGAVIDDCSLATAIKRSGGRTWLGLTRDVHSVRSYGSVAPVWDMVARTAYTQLGHSPLALVGTVAGLALIYMAPPIALAGAIALAALGRAPEAATVLALGGGAAWGLMAATFTPMLRLYRVTALLAPALPLAGALYTLFTLASAWRHWSGRAGTWRGRDLPSAPH